MNVKQELTSVDVAAVCRELDELDDAVFDKFYQHDDDSLRFKLRDYEHGRVDVVVEVGDVKRMHTVEEPEDAPPRPPNLPMLMRKRLSSGILDGVRQHGFDRVAVFQGSHHDERYTIVVELFGDGNVAFLDGDGVVLRSLRTVRLKSREVVGGEHYEYPPERVDPGEIDLDEFREVLLDSGTDLVRTLASQLNFGGMYAEEICRRADVPKETPVEEASAEEIEDVYREMSELVDAVRAGELSPKVVYEDGSPVDVVPVDVREYDGHEVEEYSRFNDALDAYFAEMEFDVGGDDEDSPLEEKRRIIRHQERAIEEKKEEEERIREDAELLYESYGAVDELLETVREARADGYSRDEIENRLENAREEGVEAAEVFRGFRDGDVVVEIDGREVVLDVSKGVEANASRLYEEAKEVAESREGAVEALEESKQELQRLEKQQKDEDAEAEGGDGGSGGSAVRPRDDMWYHRFRWFHTSDGFLVIGGRDADQNEEIHSKYMEPDDLFFHTQAHGGPVTVIKATDPSEPSKDVEFPETSREEAAQFAAAYSSVWDSGHGAADVYSADPGQVSKTPESGEYVEKGGVVVRGDREYYTVPVRLCVGLRLDGEAGVVAGPESAVEEQTPHYVTVEPGRFRPEDVADRVYRRWREEHGDVARRLAGVEEVRRYLPTYGSRIVDD